MRVRHQTVFTCLFTFTFTSSRLHPRHLSNARGVTLIRSLASFRPFPLYIYYAARRPHNFPPRPFHTHTSTYPFSFSHHLVWAKFFLSELNRRYRTLTRMVESAIDDRVISITTK
jgi:hypothetical protein